MKTLLHHYLYILSILCLSLQSCSKDDGPCGGKETYHYLAEADKAKVPYTGSDTLVFVSNTNDTAVCIGQGKRQFFEVKYTDVNAGDCEDNADLYEAYNYEYKDTNNRLNLTLNIWEYDLTSFEIMEIKNGALSLHPINLIYFFDKYYNDSATTNKQIYKTLRINNGLGFIVQYNLFKGIIQIQNNNNIWRLYEK